MTIPMTPTEALKEIVFAIETMPHSGRRATDILTDVLKRGITEPRQCTHHQSSPRTCTSAPGYVPAPESVQTYKLTYFRVDGGRYYSEGIINIFGLYGDAVNHVRNLQKAQKLPGLVENHGAYDVMFEDINGLPHLLRYEGRS